METLRLNTIHHRICNREGLSLSLYEKKPVKDDATSPALLLIHGATFSSLPEYDLQIGDYSLMHHLASHGINVYALDIRGYGNSDRPPLSDWVRAETAIRDVHTAVRFISAQIGVERISIFGWSWGTQVVGLYAQLYTHIIDRIILAAPFWKGINLTLPDISSTRRKNTSDDAISDFIDMRFAEKDVVHEFAHQCMMLDQETPTGAWKELQSLKEQPILEPSKINQPCLVIYGEHDHLIIKDDVHALYEALPNQNKKMVVISNSDHMAHLEKNRQSFVDELIQFVRS